LQKRNPESNPGGQPVGSNQQAHNPAGLIQKIATEKANSRNLITQAGTGQQAHKPGQQTHQKDVQQPLKEGADQHDDQKSPSIRRQLPQENFQLRPGLTL